MNKYQHCKTCDNFHYTDADCPPEYYVFHPDYSGEEPMKFHGDSHYDAAIKYAEYYNTNADYCLMNKTVEVSVVKVKDGTKQTFNISAEPSVDYYAFLNTPKP